MGTHRLSKPWAESDAVEFRVSVSKSRLLKVLVTDEEQMEESECGRRMLLRFGEATKDRLDLEVIFLSGIKGALEMILPWIFER